MKGFLIGAARIATALTVAGIVLAALGLAATWGYESRQKRKAAPYEVQKFWGQDLTQHLGMKLVARTKLVDSQMLLVAQFVGSPTFLNDRLLAERNRDAYINFQFSDADGFKLHEEKVDLSSFTSNLNDKGEKAGLEYQSSKYMDPEQYARIAQIGVTWNINTTPDPVAAQSLPETQFADHCAPGISRAERMKRLATRGRVREEGYNTFAVGTRSVTFSYEGGVLSCN